MLFASYNHIANSTGMRPLSIRENEIHKTVCEIILTIHKSKQYVSRERVQQQLFHHYNVESWDRLHTHPSRLTALFNLSDRQKSVTFYLQVFEHIFNLCTLHDLDSLLARFCGVTKYDDLLLGPLDKNPEVQRIFNYRSSSMDGSIPNITTGDVITRYIEFQKVQRRRGKIPFEVFIDGLVDAYGLQEREQLGIFCKSFPYLKQVTPRLIYCLPLFTL